MVANLLEAEWQKRGKDLLLLRTDAIRKARRTREIALVKAALDPQLAKLQTDVPDPENDADMAAMLAKFRRDVDDFKAKKEAALPPKLFLASLAGRLVKELGPEFVVDAGPGRTIHFSTSPSGVEHPLPDRMSQSVRNYFGLREVASVKGILSDLYEGATSVATLNEVNLAEQPALVCFTITTDPNLLIVSANAYTAAGVSCESEFLLLKMSSQFQPAAEDRKKLDDSPLTFSPEAVEFVTSLKRTALADGLKGYGKKVFEDPVISDPLAPFLKDLITAVPLDDDTTAVAIQADDFWLNRCEMMIEAKVNRLGKALDLLAQLQPLELSREATTVVIRQGRAFLSESTRIDRKALQTYYRALEITGMESPRLACEMGSKARGYNATQFLGQLRRIAQSAGVTVLASEPPHDIQPWLEALPESVFERLYAGEALPLPEVWYGDTEELQAKLNEYSSQGVPLVRTQSHLRRLVARAEPGEFKDSGTVKMEFKASIVYGMAKGGKRTQESYAADKIGAMLARTLSGKGAADDEVLAMEVFPGESKTGTFIFQFTDGYKFPVPGGSYTAFAEEPVKISALPEGVRTLILSGARRFLAAGGSG